MEKKFLDNYFLSGKDEIIQNLSQSKNLLKETYSLDHLMNKCMDKVSAKYPKDIHYYSPIEVDNRFGRKICSVFVNDPKWQSQLNDKLASEWMDTKNDFMDTFKDTYKKEVKNCNKQYPLEMGPKYVKNSRLRNICIEESFDISLKVAFEEWREEDSYEHFQERENELYREIHTQKSKMVQNAIGEEKSKM
jgi:hypothetical protein